MPSPGSAHTPSPVTSRHAPPHHRENRHAPRLRGRDPPRRGGGEHRALHQRPVLVLPQPAPATAHGQSGDFDRLGCESGDDVVPRRLACPARRRVPRRSIWAKALRDWWTVGLRRLPVSHRTRTVGGGAGSHPDRWGDGQRGVSSAGGRRCRVEPRRGREVASGCPFFRLVDYWGSRSDP